MTLQEFVDHCLSEGATMETRVSFSDYFGEERLLEKWEVGVKKPYHAKRWIGISYPIDEGVE